MKKYFTSIKSALMLTAFGLTTLGAVKAQSFTEGFENLAGLTDWYVLNNSTDAALGGNNWGAGNVATFPAQAGTGYLVANYTSSPTSAATGVTLSNWLFSPVRTFSNGDVVTFYTRSGLTTPQYADRMEVRMGTSGAIDAGTTETSVGDYTTLLLSVNPTLTPTGYPTAWTQYTITISGLAAPTTTRIAFRYFVTDGGPGGNNSNIIGLDSYSYTSVGTAPANDNCGGALPLTQTASCTPVSGNVNFATQSQAACGDGTANDDVWYQFTATTSGANISVDGSTNFDGVFEVFSGGCAGLTSLGCVDNTVNDGVEATTLNTLTIGQTYYIRVFDWYATVAGSTGFTICVSEFTQCNLTAPTGATMETETCGQDLNGGCNMVTPAYQTIACGETIFGNAWNNGTNKDTDWYRFTVNTPGTATFTATAEFPFQLYFLNIANCASPVALATATSSACQSATITYNFTTAGTYVAFIAPSGFSGYACGTNNDYIATLTLPATTPVVTATGATQVCAAGGGSVVLNATGTGTFQWFNGSTAVGGTTSTYTATAVGTYTAQVTNNNGCLGPLSAPVTITAAPLDDASFTYPSNTICDGSANVTPTTVLAGTFSATPAGLVFVSASTGEIDVAASTLGTYTVTYSTNVSCANSTSQTVTITSAPEAGFSYASASYCAGSTNPAPTFDAGSSAGTFSVTPTGLTINSATGEINLATSTPGTYTVTNSISASGACPAASSTESVIIYAQPTAVVSGGGTICNATGNTGTVNVTVTLTGTAPYDFTYTDGTTPTTITGHATNTYTITASANGTYAVTSVSDAHCSNVGTGSATVSVFSNPTVTLSALPAACSGSAVNLTQGAPAGGAYSGLGVTGSTFTAGAAGSTTITYSYTDANGCIGTTTGTIVTEATPTVTFATQTAVCSYVAPFALSGGSPAGGTYAGPGVTGGNFNPATAGVGTHTLVYTYANTTGAMCSASASQTIVVKNCAGVEENELGNSLVVYPNPTHDNVTVSFQTSEVLSADISMISLDGKTVYSKQIPQSNEFNQVINVVGFPAGIYLIQIQTANGSATRRITVQ